MDSDTIYKYLGLAIVILFVTYIILKSLTFQAKLIEGLTTNSSDDPSVNTDKDKVPDAIKSNSTNILDGLLVDKYRSSYDNTIIELEENINATILAGILKNAEKISYDPSSDESQKFITAINNLKNFKDTLNDTMKYLDGISSSGNDKTPISSNKWF
jgi:hypothetical protein